jgi:transposase
MPRSKPPYPPDFRARVIDLVRSGRTPVSLSREFNVSQQSIRAWVKQADLDSGRRQDGLTTEERQEFARLKKENARIREERDILGKAPSCCGLAHKPLRLHGTRSTPQAWRLP